MNYIIVSVDVFDGTQDFKTFQDKQESFQAFLDLHWKERIKNKNFYLLEENNGKYQELGSQINKVTNTGIKEVIKYVKHQARF